MQPDLTKRLPGVEILATTSDAWKDSCGKMQHVLRAEWVRGTWVCKTWRAVALTAPALWSCVLVSHWADGTREVQLDRPRGVALDALVSSFQMSDGQVKDAFGLVLSGGEAIKTLAIAFKNQDRAAIDAFLKGITYCGTRVAIALPQRSSVRREECITPVARAPLLNLGTHLHLDGVVGTFSEKAGKPWTFVHGFLAACPNLETFRSVDSFECPLEYLDSHNDYKDLPVATLPKLRSLSTEGLALDMSTALGTLRLPALSTFDVTAYAGMDPYDCDFYVIPRNISEAVPPVRLSRCLSLKAGGRMNDLFLQGGPGDTFDNQSDNQSDRDWSITLTDLEVTHADSQFLPCPCCQCIRYNCSRVLARMPHLVVPSRLVRLELHIANGPSVAHAQDWMQALVPMAHLRTLVIGCGALIRRIVAAFGAADTMRLCPALEEPELCFGLGPTFAVLAEFMFIPRVIGAWVRARAMPLKMLTVLTQMGSDSDRDTEDSNSWCSSDAASEEVDMQRDSAEPWRDADSADSLKLWRDLAPTMKPDSIGEVSLATIDCPTRSVEYEPPDSVQFGNGGLREGVTYY